MRCALLLERNPAARRDISALLRSMGYIVAGVDTPAAAINTAHALRCDLVLTDTTFNVDDRRAFLGELERVAPHVPIVLLAGGEHVHGHEHRRLPTLARPVTLRSLRRVIEFGLDGYGMQLAPIPAHARGEERRRHAPRRNRARS